MSRVLNPSNDQIIYELFDRFIPKINTQEKNQGYYESFDEWHLPII